MTDAAPIVDVAAIRPPRNQWWDVWDQFKTHRGALAGMIVFALIVLFCFLGPLLWIHEATFINIRARNQGFSWTHPMGTDQLGRDILARMMRGGQVSLAVGMAAMVLSILLGTLIGVISGYFRRLDGLLMRLTDLFLALPLNALLPEGGARVLAPEVADKDAPPPPRGKLMLLA
ncbi:MAG: ABC transporter permease, partial [Pararhodobacter sp.]